MTPAAVEKGVSGAMMVGMGVLKGAGCNGNAGNVRRARLALHAYGTPKGQLVGARTR
jgi:hypothetical protein